MTRLAQSIHRLAVLALLITAACAPAPAAPAVPTAPSGPTPHPAQVQVAASNRPREQAPSVAPQDLQALAEGNTTFALDLYHVLAAESGNLFYSAYSISVALAMTYAGARGDTASQMARTMHFDLPQDRLHPAFNA